MRRPGREMRMDNAPTLMEIAKRKDVDVTYKTLWNWFAKGTRLIHLCSGGGSFYFKNQNIC